MMTLIRLDHYRLTSLFLLSSETTVRELAPALAGVPRGIRHPPPAPTVAQWCYPTGRNASHRPSKRAPTTSITDASATAPGRAHHRITSTCREVADLTAPSSAPTVRIERSSSAYLCMPHTRIGGLNELIARQLELRVQLDARDHTRRRVRECSRPQMMRASRHDARAGRSGRRPPAS